MVGKKSSNGYSTKCHATGVSMDQKYVDIHFEDIKFVAEVGRFKKVQKVILKGVTGTFRCGELTAIMGPSGAGKSTLMNVLTGFQDSGIIGNVYMRPLRKTGDKNKVGLLDRTSDEEKGVVADRKMRRSLSCYIMQDDQLCPLFTVYEIMHIAANFKLGYYVPKSLKNILIEDILDKLGLLGVMYNKCGILSGGQKKRLSIALELIDNPSVMFLDEPTTGLDSRSCNMCISMLKRLARGGRTIVCTIHQPSASVFEMFDHVYVVAEGFCVYQGSCPNVVPYLQSIGLQCPQYHNPADFLMEVVFGDYGRFIPQLIGSAKSSCWRSACVSSTQTAVGINNSVDGPDDLHDIVDIKNIHAMNGGVCKTPSELQRFFMLLDRCIIKLYRDWTISHLKVLMHFLIGIVLGLLYSNCGVDGSKTFFNVGFLIVSLVYLSYTSLMPAVLKFPDELQIIRKEEFNKWYKLPTFYAAFLVTSIPTQMMFCFVYTAVAYYLSSQILDWSRFVMFLVVCQLITLISEGLGFFLGTCLAPVNGVFLGAVLTSFFILFAGYVALFAHMPRIIYYFTYLSYFRYGFEGLVIAIYGNGREPLECPTDIKYCYYKYPQSVFLELSMEENNYYLDVLSLALIFTFFITASYFSLQKRIRSTR